jgi:G patch domain-containing protein 1
MLLLKKMGWKPGQGVGPRVRPEDKAPTATAADDGEEDGGASVRMYGCFIPEEFRKRREEDDDITAGELTFAPDDVPPWTLVPKTDLFGLGYSGLARGNVLGSGLQQRGPHLVMKEKGNRRVAISGQVSSCDADLTFKLTHSRRRMLS